MLLRNHDTLTSLATLAAQDLADFYVDKVARVRAATLRCLYLLLSPSHNQPSSTTFGSACLPSFTDHHRHIKPAISILCHTLCSWRHWIRSYHSCNYSASSSLNLRGAIWQWEVEDNHGSPFSRILALMLTLHQAIDLCLASPMPPNW